MPVGLNVPVKGAVPAVIGFVGRVVEDGIDEVLAAAAHAREQRNLGPVRRDQDRGEIRIVRESGTELDGDLGDLERAAEAGNVQRRGEDSGPSRSRRGDDLPGAGARREVLRAGDRAGRAHDREHIGSGERAGCGRLAGSRVDQHGPVECHVERAGGAVGDQVAVQALPPGTDVLATCGPGTISGRVF